MTAVLLIIHIFVAIALVGVILIQRSEGGGLGFGAQGGSGSFMSVRGTANFLTRATAVLAAVFIMTSIALAMRAGNHGQGASILDQLPATPSQTAPQDGAPSTAAPTTATPVTPQSTPSPVPASPEVPLSK
jgi:preprotein translocase subunit SecG